MESDSSLGRRAKCNISLNEENIFPESKMSVNKRLLLKAFPISEIKLLPM